MCNLKFHLIRFFRYLFNYNPSSKSFRQASSSLKYIYKVKIWQVNCDYLVGQPNNYCYKCNRVHNLTFKQKLKGERK